MDTAHSAGEIDTKAKWTSVLLIALCQVLAMSLWFAASSVVPSLRLEYALGATQEALLSSAVAAGFVTGTLLSALFGLADRLDPRRYFMTAALVAAAANALMLVISPESAATPLLRFVVGLCMAGIYPVGMKMGASWAKADMGLLLGLLVGALTLGSAMPHLIGYAGGVDWRFTIAGSSVLAVAAALLINAVRLGPRQATALAFHPRQIVKAWRDPALRYANFGYFGHMWELYAMWTWIGVYLHQSFVHNPGGPGSAELAKLVTFFVIAVGGIGCLGAGWIADRLGRTLTTSAAMTMSGGCAVLVGLGFGLDHVVLTVLCLIWGVTIIADSAQFSASVMELSDKSLVGTMVTFQVCIGFLLSMVTIHLVPEVVNALGWRIAFPMLAIGPALGVLAMLRLRTLPGAVRLAEGRR
jgi:MFS family permease